MTPEKPSWWAENESLKAQFDLPAYEPPRFSDGTYTHEVVPDLEEKHDCTIRFMGVNTRYEDDWEVRVDGEPVTTVGRHRDENGNTVYELPTSEFRERLAERLEKSESR